VLIVDDSVVYRQILQTVITRISDAECVGTATSGELALKKIPLLQPDLVLLDIVMPDMDGVATLQHIKQHYPSIEAIMISSFDMNNAKETLRSLQIGALDFIAKPKVSQPEQGIDELVQYLQPLVHLLQTKKYARLSHHRRVDGVRTDIIPPAVRRSPPPAIVKRKIDLIVIGISTGGPKALDLLIPSLNASLPCPIIIVQHMPPLFTESLALKLHETSPLSVSEARGGEKLTAGHIYIAPGGKHLLLKANIDGDYYLRVDDTPPVNNCRPSVDVLFQSVAKAFKGNVLTVIMTGMGRDGTEGTRSLKAKGSICLIQDQDSSVVWGMPGSVYDAGLADEVVPLSQLSQRIMQLVTGG
jgi:two-component system chemotaxis response regulator CheB